MPKLTKLEWAVEAAALIGTALGLAVIAYGGLTQPDIVPMHIGYGGAIDSYGSKWIQLGIFTAVIILNYVLLTLAGRYLRRHAAVDANEKSAQTYRIGQAITRWVKMAFAMILIVLSAWYVAALPDNPELALGGAIVLMLMTMPLLAYSSIVILSRVTEGSRYNGMSRILKK